MMSIKMSTIEPAFLKLTLSHLPSFSLQLVILKFDFDFCLSWKVQRILETRREQPPLIWLLVHLCNLRVGMLLLFRGHFCIYLIFILESETIIEAFPLWFYTSVWLIT